MKSHVYQSIPPAAVTRIPAGAICEKSPARIAASRPSSTGMAGAVPYLNAWPQDSQPLLRHSRTAGSARSSAVLSRPCRPTPASRASCSRRPSPRRWRQATASSTNSNNPSGDAFLTAAFPRHDRGARIMTGAPLMDDLFATAELWRPQRQTQIIGDMRELQLIGHRMFVAFCYRHRGDHRPRHGIAICIRHKRRSAIAGRCQDLLYRASLPGGEMARSRSAARPELGRLVPRLAPQRRKGSRSSHAELRPNHDSNAGPTA